MSKQDYVNSQLYRIRHSAAHIMAEAMLERFPDAQIAIGPPIEDGFYYDFGLPQAPTEERAVPGVAVDVATPDGSGSRGCAPGAAGAPRNRGRVHFAGYFSSAASTGSVPQPGVSGTTRCPAS